MRVLLLILGLVLVWPLCGCAARCPLPVVEHVDVQRYVGKWYEIARYPAWFERNCVAVTAEYTLRDDGKVAVVNRCRVRTLDGREKKATAVARVVDPQTNARLKVAFFWPFEGDYQIIMLDDDYRWAVVGEPRRGYLWILSRTPQLNAATYDAILARLPEFGYDPARLEQTPQPDGAPPAHPSQ
jgi:apolipoprotein D and lipocalin family protein